ncbi:MAG: OmpH family outer membrane protein [Bacteroidota bacterium]
MKNLSLTLNILLIIAVAFLYYKVYSVKEQAPIIHSSATTKNAAIVYVNSDTLLDNYPLLKTMEKVFNSKRDSVDRILAAKDKSLKQEFADFQKRAETMPQEQAQQEYNGFMQKQQQLEALRDGLLKKLGSEQESMQDSIHNNLEAYLKEFNKTKGYEFILSYQRGSGILLADDSLNITNEVLKGIKEEK